MSTVLNVVYALLVEHATQEQADEIDRVLNAPIDVDPDAERRVADGLNLMFAGGPAPLDE